MLMEIFLFGESADIWGLILLFLCFGAKRKRIERWKATRMDGD
jgi:putative effector of murein hydrolase LrgA (UPF0299 family)